jgi:hypothetical protein
MIDLKREDFVEKRFNLKKKTGLIILTIVIASLLLLAVPVTADPVTQTIAIASGNNTETAGYSTSNISAAPLNAALYSGGGSWFNAPVIATVPGPWVAIPGAQWVSTIGTNYGDDGDYPGDAWRLFRDQFTIPAGSSNLSISIQVAADNAFELYLNNTLIDSTQNWTPVCTVYGVSPVPYGSALPYENAVTYNVTPQIGSNTIEFVVRNWALVSGNNPTGLIYYATVTYDTGSEPPPPSIGGTINKSDKLELILPWLGIGLGVILLLFTGVRRLIFKKK